MTEEGTKLTPSFF